MTLKFQLLDLATTNTFSLYFHLPYFIPVLDSVGYNNYKTRHSTEATAGEPILATSVWGMLYADDPGVVSQWPEQLRKMMGVIVVVCAAFGLIVSEAKTEIMCLRTKGVPESTAIFSIEAAGQVYNQMNGFVYFRVNVNYNVDLSIEVYRRIRNAWCSFRKCTLELCY